MAGLPTVPVIIGGPPPPEPRVRHHAETRKGEPSPPAAAPVLWQGGKPRHLPVRVGFNTCEPGGINNHLRVTMRCYDAHNGPAQGPAPQGYVWHRYHYYLLPTLSGATDTRPGAITDEGQIASTVTTAAGDTAVLWTR
jgi:hypothetical protein